MSTHCECGCTSDCICSGRHHASGLRPPANRPGLGALAARLGDYGDFFADALGQLGAAHNPELSRLSTREPDDATIGLLDAWSVTADVLTFYNERLANEGYLRTAREDFSLRELAALVGYRPRPGVAASVPLAFKLDADAAPVEIPRGARAQTVPGPGETLQSFETTDPLTARTEWSEMKPRRTRLPRIDLYDALSRDRIWLADASLIVQAGERLLFIFNRERLGQVAREVASATPDVLAGRLLIRLKPIPGLTYQYAKRLIEPLLLAMPGEDPDTAIGALLEAAESFLLGGSLNELAGVLRASYPARPRNAIADLARATADFAEKIAKTRPDQPGPTKGESSPSQIFGPLERTPRRQPKAARDIGGSLETSLAGKADGAIRLAAALSPALTDTLYGAWRQMPAAEQTPLLQSVQLLRLTASSFGANAPPMAQREGRGFVFIPPPRARADERALHLDAVYDGIETGSYVVMRGPVRYARTPHDDA